MTILALIKHAICRLGLGPALVEYCHTCGRRVRQVWWAHPELWYEIERTGDAGVRCIPCFDSDCAKAGVLVKWHPIIETRRGPDGKWLPVPPPDPEFYPVAARLHSEPTP